MDIMNKLDCYLFTSLNEDAANAKKVLQMLKSDDFKDAFPKVSLSGDVITILDPGFSHRANKDEIDKKWSETGTYGKYFKEELGVTFTVKLVTYVEVPKGKMSPGYTQIQIKVN